MHELKLTKNCAIKINGIEIVKFTSKKVIADRRIARQYCRTIMEAFDDARTIDRFLRTRRTDKWRQLFECIRAAHLFVQAEPSADVVTSFVHLWLGSPYPREISDEDPPQEVIMDFFTETLEPEKRTIKVTSNQMLDLTARHSDYVRYAANLL